MKIVRFAVDGKARYGILRNQSIQAIDGKPFRQIKLNDQYYQRNQVKLLAPCQPSKIIAMGLNHHNHAKELNSPVPNSPLTFLKPPTAVIGPGDDIVYPSASARVDYEGELAAVIKKPVWRVDAKDALDYVLGYTCFNDITARDLQNRDGQWTRAKALTPLLLLAPGLRPSLTHLVWWWRPI